MAGTITASEETFGLIKKIVYDWLSDASGDASATSTSAAFSGQILRVECVPDSSTTQPSDQYDITLTTADSIDVLYGQGANLSNSSTVAIVSNLGVIANDVLSLTVANGGNAKGGLVYVYIR